MEIELLSNPPVEKKVMPGKWPLPPPRPLIAVIGLTYVYVAVGMGHQRKFRNGDLGCVLLVRQRRPVDDGWMKKMTYQIRPIELRDVAACQAIVRENWGIGPALRSGGIASLVAGPG